MAYLVPKSSKCKLTQSCTLLFSFSAIRLIATTHTSLLVPSKSQSLPILGDILCNFLRRLLEFARLSEGMIRPEAETKHQHAAPHAWAKCIHGIHPLTPSTRALPRFTAHRNK